MVTRRSTPTEDQNLIDLITKNSESGHVKIYDARPKLNADANRLRGGGYESTVTFCDIGNIHKVSESYKQMCQLAFKSDPRKLLAKQIDKTRYMQILQAILESVNQILGSLDMDSHSVIVHCSDGWDRTSQMCALA